MAVNVNKAVNSIKQAIDNGGRLPMVYDQGVDGLSYEVKNWPALCPVLENLLEQSWFPDRDWVGELIAQNKAQPLLKLSEDRINQLENVIEEVSERLPVVLEAWSVLVHPKSGEAFHVGIETQDFPELRQLADNLGSIFKLLAIDNSFSVTVSEAFILVVPEGPYSHFCAVFALSLAKKTLALTESAEGADLREIIRLLPEYKENTPDKMQTIEGVIHQWVATKLTEDWDWFERVRAENFGDQPNNARNNIEKAVPLLCALLREGNCYIEPPINSPEEASFEMEERYDQLLVSMDRVSRALTAGESLVRTALQTVGLGG